MYRISDRVKIVRRIHIARRLCIHLFTNLSFADLNNRVRETQFPSTSPRPTVGTLFLHATYTAHASHCMLSPYGKDRKDYSLRMCNIRTQESLSNFAEHSTKILEQRYSLFSKQTWLPRETNLQSVVCPYCFE